MLRQTSVTAGASVVVAAKIQIADPRPESALFAVSADVADLLASYPIEVSAETRMVDRLVALAIGRERKASELHSLPRQSIHAVRGLCKQRCAAQYHCRLRRRG